MDKIIKKVLNTLEKNGFEAYVIGGYVRDSLLGKFSYDIDICTNALPKDLIEVFPNGDLGNYGTLNFKIKRYDFEITTYRKEVGYENRKPREIIYINNLIEDLKRRDFLINTICMNQRGHIIDMLDGYKDIEEKNIRMVGNPIDKFIEDPLRILRAIRFATILNFSLDNDIKDAIKKCAKEISTLSTKRIKDELEKILISDNCLAGIKLMDDFNLFNILDIKHEEIKRVPDVMGMWSQFELSSDFPFTKEQKNNIIKIKEIVKSGLINNRTLFNNGLYLSLVAGEILNIDKVIINKEYKKLPIYTSKDLAVTSKELMDYLSIDGKELGLVVNELVEKVLNNQLKNDKKSIYNYLNNKKER